MKKSFGAKQCLKYLLQRVASRGINYGLHKSKQVARFRENLKPPSWKEPVRRPGIVTSVAVHNGCLEGGVPISQNARRPYYFSSTLLPMPGLLSPGTVNENGNTYDAKWENTNYLNVKMNNEKSLFTDGLLGLTCFTGCAGPLCASANLCRKYLHFYKAGTLQKINYYGDDSGKLACEKFCVLPWPCGQIGKPSRRIRPQQQAGGVMSSSDRTKGLMFLHGINND